MDGYGNGWMLCIYCFMCLENGKCGKPPRIPNGKIDFETGRITCNEGYSTQIQEANCHEGNWNLPKQKICQRESVSLHACHISTFT